MAVDLQKAGVTKRVAAWLLDSIVVSILAVGIGLLLAVILGYDANNAALQNAYAGYEEQYGVRFDISQEAYAALEQEGRETYDAAYAALIGDPEVLRLYDLVINQMLLILTFSLLAGIVVGEFLVPLLLKNGQTVGKKVFGLGLIRVDGVKVNGLQLFTRGVLGKFAVETMVPVYCLMLFFFGSAGLLGLLIPAALGILQLVMLAVTRENALLHDKMAGTAVVDIASQQIFESTEARIAYTKKIHAEKADRQDC